MATSNVVDRIENNDPTLTSVTFKCKVRFGSGIDANIIRFIDALITHPSNLEAIYIQGNGIGDEEFIKIAQYVSTSSTIRSLNLSMNKASYRGYVAIANALRTNSSLKYLTLYDNVMKSSPSINCAFINALRLNPRNFEPNRSSWYLYDAYIQNAVYLKNHAKQASPPSMLEFLLHVHQKNKLKWNSLTPIKTKCVKVL